MKAFCEKCFKEVEPGPGFRCPACGSDVSEEAKRKAAKGSREGMFEISWGTILLGLIPIVLGLFAAWWFWGRKPYVPPSSPIPVQFDMPRMPPPRLPPNFPN